MISVISSRGLQSSDKSMSSFGQSADWLGARWSSRSTNTRPDLPPTPTFQIREHRPLSLFTHHTRKICRPMAGDLTRWLRTSTSNLCVIAASSWGQTAPGMARSG